MSQCIEHLLLQNGLVKANPVVAFIPVLLPEEEEGVLLPTVPGGGQTAFVNQSNSFAAQQTITSEADAIRSLTLIGHSPTTSVSQLQILSNNSTTDARAKLEFLSKTSGRTMEISHKGDDSTFRFGQSGNDYMLLQVSSTLPFFRTPAASNAGFGFEIDGTGTIYFGSSSTTNAYTMNFGVRSDDGAICKGGTSNFYGVTVVMQAISTATATVVTGLTLQHHTSGTPGVGFGHGLVWQLDSSTTANRSAAEVDVSWAAATDATRKARVTHYAYDTAVRETFREEASGAAAMIGFLGSAAVVQQSGDIGAALTAYGLVTSPTLPASSLTAVKYATSLYDRYADANNTGTSETVLYADALGAGKLAANGDKVVAEYGGTFTGAVSATQQLRVYFGPSGTNADTLVFDSGALSIGVASPSWDMMANVIRESSSVVRVTASLTTSSAALAADAQYTRVTGLTLANQQYLTITGTAGGVGGGSNQITASQGYGQYAPAA